MAAPGNAVAIISQLFTKDGRPLRFYLQKELDEVQLEELREKILENGGTVLEQVPRYGFYIYDAANPRSKSNAAAFSDFPEERAVVHWTFIDECIAADSIVDHTQRMPDEPRPRPVVELDIEADRCILLGFLEKDYKDQLTIYFHSSISDRRTRWELCNLVQDHAGFYVMRPQDARIIIADDTGHNFDVFQRLREEARFTDQYIETEKTLRKWINTGNVHTTGPTGVRGQPGRPPGTKPIEYTNKDDEILTAYLAREIPDEATGGRRGNTVYQGIHRYLDSDHGFAAFTPDDIAHARLHPWESWRTRYRNHKEHFDKAIKRYVKKYKELAHSGGKFPMKRGHERRRMRVRSVRDDHVEDDSNEEENEDDEQDEQAGDEANDEGDDENEEPQAGPSANATPRRNPSRRAQPPRYKTQSSSSQWKVPKRVSKKQKGKARRDEAAEEEHGDVEMDLGQHQDDGIDVPSSSTTKVTSAPRNNVPSSIPPAYATQAAPPTYRTQAPQASVRNASPGPSRQVPMSSAHFTPASFRVSREEVLSSPFQLTQPARHMPVLSAVQLSRVSPPASQVSAANVSTGSGDADEVEQVLAETPDEGTAGSAPEDGVAPMSDVEETETSEETSPQQAIPSSTQAFLDDATSVPLAQQFTHAGPSRTVAAVRYRPRASDPFPALNEARRRYRPSFGTFGRTDMDGPRVINFYMADDEQAALRTPEPEPHERSNAPVQRDRRPRKSFQDAQAELRAERERAREALIRSFPEFSSNEIDGVLSDSADLPDLARTRLLELQQIYHQARSNMRSPSPVPDGDYHPPARSRAAKARRVSERIGEA